MSTGSTVLFIHGLWLHADSWQPWIDLFREAGYDPAAPGWPGDPETVEEARANPDAIADHGIDDVVAHYAKIIGGLDAPPILVGHSFGGMIAQKLLGQDLAAAAIAIDAAQIKGVLPLPLSALRSTLPVFKNPANKHKAVSLTAEQFRYAFGNAIPPTESDELFDRWTIPGPGRPLFEASTANFSRTSPAAVDTRKNDRGPLLIIGGGKDHTVPEVVARAAYNLYAGSRATTDYQSFPDRGHSLVFDHGWREIADFTLAWLNRQGI
jgi:non-heme chloroperoxidase